MTPELHRPVAVERIGPAGLDLRIEATAAECAAIAARMQVPAVLALACHFHVERDLAEQLVAHGHLMARVVQTCVVTLEEFAAPVEERFAVRFVPEGTETHDVDPEALDEVPYEGAVIDLGEAAAEQLALALDPYPRAPNAELPEMPQDAESGPFGALDALRRRH